MIYWSSFVKDFFKKKQSLTVKIIAISSFGYYYYYYSSRGQLKCKEIDDYSLEISTLNNKSSLKNKIKECNKLIRRYKVRKKYLLSKKIVKWVYFIQ
jgi:hypothetical protein